MSEKLYKAQIAEAERIIAQIRPLLAGKAPEVQGIVVNELLATHIASHHPALREEMLELAIETIRKLIPFNVPASAPPDWHAQ